MNVMRFAVFSARALAAVLCLGAAAPASAATVTVKKIVVPAGDTGKFTLQLKTGSGQLLANFLNAGGGATMGPVTVPAGPYNVSEVAGLNTSLANYTPVITGAGCAANGNVTVTGNANITCTITNTRIAANGTVTVKKIVVPAGDTGKFTLQLKTGSGQLLANFLNAGGGATMGPVTVPAGPYNVSEVAGLNTSLANYTPVITGAGCAANGNVTVTANANIVCTITNTHIVSACTGFPLVANVNFYSPAQPFGPQTVDICRGGHVVFHNVSSGAALTITWLSGPTGFPAVPVAAANGSLGSTIVLPTAGNEEYKISGYTLHGHIIVH